MQKSTLEMAIVMLLLMLAGTIALAQGVLGGLSPVPIWPTNGVIPPELASNYVFYDPPTEEAVASFPENLGTPEFASNPGPRRIVRIETSRGARPTLSFSVTGAGTGRYEYQYRLENGAGARKPITAWEIPVPPLGAGDTVGSPEFWRGIASETRLKVTTDAFSSPLAKSGTGGIRFLQWFFEDDRGVIAPGRAAGFSVTASYKPGVIIGYVRGGLLPNPPADLPREVSLQLRPVLAMEFNLQRVIAIGPKFVETARRTDIAADFHIGISQLVRAKQLDGNSPAIIEALDVLARHVTEAVSFENAPLVLLAKPKEGLEAQILQALTLSMRVN